MPITQISNLLLLSKGHGSAPSKTSRPQIGKNAQN